MQSLCKVYGMDIRWIWPGYRGGGDSLIESDTYHISTLGICTQSRVYTLTQDVQHFWWWFQPEMLSCDNEENTPGEKYVYQLKCLKKQQVLTHDINVMCNGTSP